MTKKYLLDVYVYDSQTTYDNLCGSYYLILGGKNSFKHIPWKLIGNS